jgi:[acyl-carrier-protein] S-malonyltransferase
MGRTFFDTCAESREVFEQANDALGFSITDLCFSGPEDKLKLTEITQPSILTVSVAVWGAIAPKLVDAGHEVACAAGHSLGEYSALVAAGALDFTDAVKLVHRRGRLMQEAVPEGRGAMCAVLGLDARDVDAVCADARAQSGEVVNLANLNSPGQWVISGSIEGIGAAEPLLKERGAKKLIRLPVSAPFHSPLMKPATEGMRALLAATGFKPTQFPVIANSTADTYPADCSHYAHVLTEQIESPVRWIETGLRFRRDFGAECALEIGPGKVLSGLLKRIDSGLPAINVGTVEQMDYALEWLGTGCNAGVLSV